MRPFFTDKALQQEYNNKGYIKVKIMEPEAVKELAAQCKPYIGEQPGFYSLLCHKNDPLEKARVFQLIWEAFAHTLNSLFINFVPVKGTFLIKNIGPEGDFAPHQDWTIVDEKEHRGFLVWLPLLATNITNGALHLVPGTHKLNNNPRVVPESIFPYKEEKHLKLLKKHAELVQTHPGEAIIFDHKVIHYSLPNVSAQKRIVAGMIMVPAEAQTRHYCLSRTGETDLLDVCHVNRDILMQFSHDELPVKTQVIGQVPKPIYPDAYRELRDILEPPLLKRIKSKLMPAKYF